MRTCRVTLLAALLLGGCSLRSGERRELLYQTRLDTMERVRKSVDTACGPTINQACFDAALSREILETDLAYFRSFYQ